MKLKNSIKLYMVLIIVLVLCGLGTLYTWREELDFNIVTPEEFNYDLEAGTWIFAISYNNNGQENYVEIYSPDTMDSEGNIGKVYGRIELPIEKNRITQEITLEEYETNVQIRLMVKTGEANLTEVSYRNNKKYNDSIIWYFLFSSTIIIILIFFKKGKKESKEIFVCLSGVVFIAMLPYMNSFLQHAHDLVFHLLRIEGIYHGLKNGEFPIMVNTIQSNGFGYITPVLYPQSLLYIPALFRLMGMSLLNSYKLLVLLGTIITVAVSYFSFKHMLKSPWAGMVTTSLYTLGIYRLTNVYCRAAVGEFLASAFLPLIFYGMYEILVGDKKKWIWAALGFTFTFQQHLLTTEISLLFTLFACVICIKYMLKEPSRLVSLCKAAFLTLLLNIGSILPILSYAKEKLNIFEYNGMRYLPDVALYLSEVFASFVKLEGKQVLRGSTYGEMPLTIGGLLLLAVICFIVYCYIEKAKINQCENLRQQKKLGVICIILGSLAIVMTMWFFPWSIFTKILFVNNMIGALQYLSRLLAVPALTFCIVVGILAVFLLREFPSRKLIIIGCMYIAAIGGCIYSLDSMIQQESYKSREEVAALSYTDDLYLYSGDSQEPLQQMGKRIWVSPNSNIRCLNISRKGSRMQCDLEILNEKEGNYIELPLYYYPQYVVELNGKMLDTEKGENGAIRAYLDEDCSSGKLIAYYRMPFSWKLGKVMSMFIFVTVVLYLCIDKKRRMKGE